MNKELNTLITIAKDINDLVEIIASDEISRQDLEEVDEISPGIKGLIMSFEDWIFDNIKTETKPEIVVTPVVPQKKTITVPEKSTGKKRNKIPEKDIVKMTKIICNMIPDEGAELNSVYVKKVENEISKTPFNKYITSRLIVSRILFQETYKKTTAKYFVFADGKIYRK